MELEVKILIIEKELLYLEIIFFIKRKEDRGKRHQLFGICFGVLWMDGGFGGIGKEESLLVRRQSIWLASLFG